MFVSGVAALILLTVENTQVMFAPRVLYGLARDGLLPRGLTRVAGNGLPWVAALITIILSAGLAMIGAYDALLAIYAPLSVASFAFVDLSAIVLRQREPHLPRPWRMPLYPAPALGALVVNVGLLTVFVAGDSENSRWALLLLASALPLYLIYVRRLRHRTVG